MPRGNAIVRYVGFIINISLGTAICENEMKPLNAHDPQLKRSDKNQPDEIEKHEVGVLFSVILVGKNQIQVQFLQPSAHAPHTFNRYAACRTNDELPEDRGFEILVYYSFATEREERATREPSLWSL